MASARHTPEALRESPNGAFEGDQLATATAGLGVYSNLQSLHSEDAVTWSYFGPLAVEPPEARADFLTWLLLQLGLDNWTGSERASIDLWRRVPHPDKSLPGGPELDFVIDGDRCVVFGVKAPRVFIHASRSRTRRRPQPLIACHRAR